ncbi:MAG: glucoamylase family protein [Balneolales bacterium]
MIDYSKVTFNINYLKESAIHLAELHATTQPTKKIYPVKPILDQSRKVLNDAYRILSGLARDNQDLSPAAEWLIDNFYIIQEQIVEVGVDFPKEFQRNLPSLNSGEHEGLPRVYELVMHFLTHTDNLVDEEVLGHYIKSYQEAEILLQGEIWAIPIMLRLILVQKLAEKASRILYRKCIWKDVHELMGNMAGRDLEEPGLLISIMSDWLSKEERTESLITLIELYNQLQQRGLLLEEQKRWFIYRFKQHDITIEEAMHLEAQRQSRLQVSIQNAVVTLRESSETDWNDFVENCSRVDHVLRQDPFGLYTKMDFNTRDRYRKSVEKLSRGSGKSEMEVAGQALSLSVNASYDSEDGVNNLLFNQNAVKKHIGYYLTGDGYFDFAESIRYRMPLRERVQRRLEKNPVWYVWSIFLLTVLLMLALFVVTAAYNETLLISVTVFIIALFPALDLSVSAVNRFFAFLLPPRTLPKMDYKDNIPGESRTLVVVPTLLSSPDDVRQQVEKLEVRSLANPHPGLQFALLTDFFDADTQKTEGDEDILNTVKDAIYELNQKYSSRYGDKFYVLHRERLWNESEHVWMGWERKRGKLEEFNRLLRDPLIPTSYTLITGDFVKSVEMMPVKYVITLDADTQLPPDSAVHLIRTISHPLNRAWYDPDKRRITKGYAIIQPRISIPPSSARKTWFSRIFSGNVGLDPYSTAVSDIYQDLAGEAVFTGKGIYDVQAYHEVLNMRFPENRILSHDLIESAYLRTGLATDLELFDDFPSTYLGFSKRNHRWTRGDWQIAAWLFPQVPSTKGKEKNRINLLSRWKIFDNLRRSLNSFFLTLFFIGGWFWLPGAAWIWTLAAFSILAFPIYVSLSADIINRPARVRWKVYLDKVRSNLKMNTIQALLTVIILPHQAVVHLDAVFRTLYRLLVSKKWLLEWTTASQTESGSPDSLMTYFRFMIFTVVLGIAIFVVSIALNVQYLWITGPFFLIWACSPWYLYIISQPFKPPRPSYTDEDLLRLRLYARRTWSYFERFVNEDHAWLPPDNYQVDPPLPAADRTSPTNIGLSLISTQVAYNMGYITYSEFLDRQVKTLQSLEKLERYKGHFYNWYQTRLGEVLNPRYISTVDSGNLAAGLILIKEGVKKSTAGSAWNSKYWDGLSDTIITVKKIFKKVEEDQQLPDPSYARIQAITHTMLKRLENREHEGLELLRALKDDAVSLSSTNLLPLRSQLEDYYMFDLLYWIERPLNQIENAIGECKCLNFAKNLNFSKMSPEEMNMVSGQDEQNPSCLKLLNKWKKQVEYIVSTSEKLVDEMDFSFLYLPRRRLFSIGYNVDKAILDISTYDLLASEARIASYIAIAKGDIPVEHWFRLSRRLTSLNREEILLSWGGTMFEYLMPLLFMRNYTDTLIDLTYKNVVNWQRGYGKNQNKPWGFSESAYYFLNIDMHYQYRAFGAPGLGLKRGLAEDHVVAPYASLLALMVDPKSPLENLEELEKAGGYGLYGFFDAIDYTPSRLEGSETHKVVKTYLGHHHGMGLIALENILNNNSIQENFHSDLRIKGCELLLQERIPRGVPIKEPHPIEVELEPGEQETVQNVVEHAGIEDLDVSPPRLHMLSNGKYSTYLTHAGTGGSVYNGLAINGWDPDPTIDPLGLFFYIKDTESGEYWSAMHQPVKRKPDRYDTWFHNGKIITSRVDDWIETTTEASVSPDYNMEFRKLTLTNYSDRVRSLEITSYAEVVLNRPQDHSSHPAFSKLFVQTEYLARHHALIAKRRPRSDQDQPMWLVHSFARESSDGLSVPLQFETERSQFIGRGRSLSKPQAMDTDNQFVGSIGNISDPIVSLRKQITIEPGKKVVCSFGMGYASTREEAVQLADMFDNHHTVQRAFDLAAVYSSVELNHIGINSRQAHHFQQLASYLIYSNKKYRTDDVTLRGNRNKQNDLWAYGISGDLPIVVFRINHMDQIKQIHTILNAHAFWRIKGLKTELMILNDHGPTYADGLQEAIQQVLETSTERGMLNTYGGIFIQRTDKLPYEDLILLLSIAHVIFDEKIPSTKELNHPKPGSASWYSNSEGDQYHPVGAANEKPGELKQNTDELIYFNGFGGFSLDGKEYHILIKPDEKTGRHQFPPAPWVNVIANQDFGFIATERGAGYIWSENSRENKLTAWLNDPVKDPHTEAFYIRDNDSKMYWSPTPGPVPGNGDYAVIHGFGYTSYMHFCEDLEQELVQFVPVKGSVKISRLRITNTSQKIRNLTLFKYTDRVLGVNRNSSSRHIISRSMDHGKTLYAQNFYNNEFAGRPVYSSVHHSGPESAIRYTTSREAFIGRNRSLNRPFVVSTDQWLDNQIISGSDPCAAFQINDKLQANKTMTLWFLDGEALSFEEADQAIAYYADLQTVDSALDDVKAFWENKLSPIQVSTPDKSMDLMVNGWLMYQNLSCRIWGRTAYYQAGGAFGFRDQLQDSMSLLYADPDLTRQQILLHASKQFKEGDVLHWWHPPTGRGIRSKITDDRLWLPFVTEKYIRTTGDESILYEEVSYISAPGLERHEHEVYLVPHTLDVKDSLYDHCCKAIDISLQFGTHGLPLMGAGDWNDGMNRVGEAGHGESVWLGFFIYITLNKFQKICTKLGDVKRAERYRSVASELKNSLNKEGWDGEWFLRAYYDDGTPLGSSSNSECKIDAISQAWAVISGLADHERAMKAINAAEKHLISEKDKIIRLLAPPFDKTNKNPGYIKGYIPGVRENGGQYTHGALWLIKAMAELGMGDKAVRYMNMINPIHHGSTKESSLKYKVEPYVVAADIYGVPPLTGMGGWTWYTGSGGWMYRVMLESILGFRIERGNIKLKPAISAQWKSYRIKYRADEKGTIYDIRIHNPNNLETGMVNGKINGKAVQFKNQHALIKVLHDGKVHHVELSIVESVKVNKTL